MRNRGGIFPRKINLQQPVFIFSTPCCLAVRLTVAGCRLLLCFCMHRKIEKREEDKPLLRFPSLKHLYYYWLLMIYFNISTIVVSCVFYLACAHMHNTFTGIPVVKVQTPLARLRHCCATSGLLQGQARPFRPVPGHGHGGQQSSQSLAPILYLQRYPIRICPTAHETVQQG